MHVRQLGLLFGVLGAVGNTLKLKAFVEFDVDEVVVLGASYAKIQLLSPCQCVKVGEELR